MSTEAQAPPAVPTVTLTIDDQEVTVPKGTLLIEAAKTIGIEIPYLCYYHKLTPFGGCRLCLVEVEKARSMLAACNTTVMDGMVVRTKTDKVKDHRKGVLEFILLNHPLDCPVCDKGGECELQDRTFQHGPTISRLTEPKIHIEDYDLGPLIVRNQDRCIICKRCVKVMEEVVGDPVLEFGQRGVTTEVYTFEHSHFPAGFSGNTIKVCPVGALMSKPFRFKARPWELVKTPSVCSHCSMGCSLRVDMRENQLMRVVGLDQPQVNDGWLCDRGQFGYDYANSPQRLRTPLVRKNGQLESVSWDEALGVVAERLNGIKASAGVAAIGGIGSEVTSNEDSFVFQAFLRRTVGTNNIDHRMGTERLGYAALRPGPGAIAALPKSDVVLLFGSDLTAEVPVMDLVLKKSLLTGKMKLIVAHPRRIELNKFARQWLRYAPGTEMHLLKGISRVMLDEGLVAEGVAAARGAEFESLAQSLRDVQLADVAKLTGVPEAEIQAAARALAGAKQASVIYGRRLADAQDGAATVAALGNLMVLAGQDAKEGLVFLEAVEHANTWGARDMGVLPDSGPGFGSATRGLSTRQMLEAAVKGELKALLVMGNNLLVRYPNGAKARQALEALEFLVVQDLFLTETAQLADVVLPAASAMEKNGTFTNVEGRVQRLTRAMDPVGGCRADWQILDQLSEKMGQPLGYDMVEKVVADIRTALAAAPAGAKPLSLTREEAAPRVTTTELYPLKLITGRLMFDHSTVQLQSSVLHTLAPAPHAQIHPKDADRHGIDHAAPVVVQSQTGKLELTAHVTEDVPAGTVFIPAGYNDAPVNALLTEDVEIVGVRLSRP
jgi:NADH-quinone oxidoreductase subunit G